MYETDHKKKFDLKNLVVELMDTDKRNEIELDYSGEKRHQNPQWQQVILCFIKRTISGTV